VVRSSGQDMPIPQTQCKAAVAPEIAAGMTYAMKRVISGGTGGASATGDGTMLAGKTGTTDSGVHTWMTGFSSAVATATWVGNVSGAKTLSKIMLNHKAGNTVRHDIWRTIMKVADKEYPTTALANPPQSMIDATYMTVPTVSGQLQTDAVQHIQASDLNAAVVVTPIASSQPKGTVAYTRPAAGQSIPRGSQVRIFISAGGMVRIPSVGVVGETVATATATLKALGFPQVMIPQPSQVQYMQHSATVPAGNVIGTVPGVGKSADVRGAILLILSTGP